MLRFEPQSIAWQLAVRDRASQPPARNPAASAPAPPRLATMEQHIGAAVSSVISILSGNTMNPNFSP